jgi:hypothetical protein
MDNVQKHDKCITITSSQTFRYYFREVFKTSRYVFYWCFVSEGKIVKELLSRNQVSLSLISFIIFAFLVSENPNIPFENMAFIF